MEWVTNLSLRWILLGFLGSNSALAHLSTLGFYLFSWPLPSWGECYWKVRVATVIRGGWLLLLVCLEQKRVREEDRKKRVRKVEIKWLIILVIEAFL
jgi:hypothetical protein